MHLSLFLSLSLSFFRDDTSGEDGEDKDPPVAIKGRRTANSRGHRKGRITRSMANEQEESSSPPLSGELGQYSHVNTFTTHTDTSGCTYFHCVHPQTHILPPWCGNNLISRY